MKKKTIERIYLSNEEFIKTENEIRFHEHLRRYAAIRRFCYGDVLDFACGCGYGTYLLAANPEVKNIIGVDIDSKVIEWAKKEFNHSKATYLARDIKGLNLNKKIDTLVCLETIEHIKELNIIKEVIDRHSIDQLIFCFPDKKSTHFNSFHFHDFVLQDIIDLFPTFLGYHIFRSVDVQFVLFMKLPSSAPSHIFRNLFNL